MRRTPFRLIATVLCATVLCIAATNAAQAQQTQDQLDALQKQQEALAAIATANATIAARNSDRIDSLTGPLTKLTTATGKTELTGDAGSFEAWLMSAHALDAAAVQIRGKLKPGSYVVVDAADEIDTTSVTVLAETMRWLDNRGNALAASCRPKTAGGPEVGFFPPVAAIAAVLGALRSDTTITGVAGPTDADLLINALTTDPVAGLDFYRPKGITAVGTLSDSPLWQAWGRLDGRVSMLTGCAAKLKKAKKESAALDAYLAQVEVFRTTNVITADGKSPLIRAVQISTIASLPVLRITLAKSGGSIIKRQNIATALGARAIGVTGGALIAWRVYEPGTGRVTAGGNLLCTTQVTGLRNVQNRMLKPAACGPSIEESK